MLWNMITRNYNSTSHKNKEDQTLGPEKLSAQVKSSLFSLLWEEKVSHEATSMKDWWQLSRPVNTQHVENSKCIYKRQFQKNMGLESRYVGYGAKPYSMAWLWLPKLEWCGVQLLRACNVHGFSWSSRQDIQEYSSKQPNKGNIFIEWITSTIQSIK